DQQHGRRRRYPDDLPRARGHVPSPCEFRLTIARRSTMRQGRETSSPSDKGPYRSGQLPFVVVAACVVGVDAAADATVVATVVDVAFAVVDVVAVTAVVAVVAVPSLVVVAVAAVGDVVAPAFSAIIPVIISMPVAPAPPASRRARRAGWGGGRRLV